MKIKDCELKPYKKGGKEERKAVVYCALYNTKTIDTFWATMKVPELWDFPWKILLTSILFCCFVRIKAGENQVH